MAAGRVIVLENGFGVMSDGALMLSVTDATVDEE